MLSRSVFMFSFCWVKFYCKRFKHFFPRKYLNFTVNRWNVKLSPDLVLSTNGPHQRPLRWQPSEYKALCSFNLSKQALITATKKSAFIHKLIDMDKHRCYINLVSSIFSLFHGALTLKGKSRDNLCVFILLAHPQWNN